MSGSDTFCPNGVYGTMGVPDAANVPGGRSNSVSWTDSTGNLWFFGGWDCGMSNYNDLWRYEIEQECNDDNDCNEGETCVDGSCKSIPDNPPVLTAGPFLAAGTWPVLPTSAESPMYLDQNYSVLWTFSDDFAPAPKTARTQPSIRHWAAALDRLLRYRQCGQGICVR